MEYRRILPSRIEDLWALQQLYKAEIGEAAPTDADKARLRDAMVQDRIRFYGAWEGEALMGCCSVTVGFSTFDYGPSGVLEDFYIRPACRHTGVARRLIRLAHEDSGVTTLTVGCAACDLPLYRALGFTLPLGSLLAYE